MEKQTLTRELEALTEKLSALQAEAEEAAASSSALEEEFNQAQARLGLARRAIEEHEARLAEKQAELKKAEREQALQLRDEAAARLTDASSKVLVELEAFEAAERAVSALEGHPESAGDERDALGEPWTRLKEAVRQRIDTEFADEVLEAAVRSRMPDAMNALPAHLREAARVRIQARKRERHEEAR
jgi:chromosome segregation ATPase